MSKTQMKPPVRIVTIYAAQLFRTVIELLNDAGTEKLIRNGGRVVLHVHGRNGLEVIEPNLKAMLP